MGFFDRLNELPRHKSKKELDEHFDKMNLEKGDFLAMVMAGFAVFVPILLGLGLIILLFMKLFRAI